MNLVEKSLRKMKGRRETFLCGDSGPLALSALLYNKLGQKDQALSCISK